MGIQNCNSTHYSMLQVDTSSYYTLLHIKPPAPLMYYQYCSKRGQCLLYHSYPTSWYMLHYRNCKINVLWNFTIACSCKYRDYSQHQCMYGVLFHCMLVNITIYTLFTERCMQWCLWFNVYDLTYTDQSTKLMASLPELKFIDTQPRISRPL